MEPCKSVQCPHTESSFATSWQAGWQAGYGKRGNTLESIHWELKKAGFLLTARELQCITVFTIPCLPTSRKTAFNVWPALGCPHTESNFARSWQAGWQAGFGKHGNTLESSHWDQDPGCSSSCSQCVDSNVDSRVYQTLPVSFSQNCSQCVGTLTLVPCRVRLCCVVFSYVGQPRVSPLYIPTVSSTLVNQGHHGLIFWQQLKHRVYKLYNFEFCRPTHVIWAVESIAQDFICLSCVVKELENEKQHDIHYKKHNLKI